MTIDETPSNEGPQPERSGLTRRQVLQRGAALGGAAAWAVPTVQVLGIPSAAAGTPIPQCCTAGATAVRLGPAIIGEEQEFCDLAELDETINGLRIEATALECRTEGPEDDDESQTNQCLARARIASLTLTDTNLIDTPILNAGVLTSESTVTCEEFDNGSAYTHENTIAQALLDIDLATLELNLALALDLDAGVVTARTDECTEDGETLIARVLRITVGGEDLLVVSESRVTGDGREAECD